MWKKGRKKRKEGRKMECKSKRTKRSLMIVEWVRRDDGALLRRSPRPYSTVIHPPSHAGECYVNNREKSASLPSSRLYTISSLSSFWVQNIPKNNRVSRHCNMVDSERMGRKQKEKLDSLARLYHDRIIKQGRIQVPLTILSRCGCTLG